MVTLDLRNEGNIFIKCLENKVRSFELTAKQGAPVITGATITMKITKGVLVQSLSVGSGITITAANKFAITIQALSQGLYNYILEIMPVSGEQINIIGDIHCTNG